MGWDMILLVYDVRDSKAGFLERFQCVGVVQFFILWFPLSSCVSLSFFYGFWLDGCLLFGASGVKCGIRFSLNSWCFLSFFF
jgi:hypothetical protein